jgi:hypothetical protein
MNMQNKSKKGAVKPKKGDKKEGTPTAAVGEKENQPALTLKDLEI